MYYIAYFSVSKEQKYYSQTDIMRAEQVFKIAKGFNETEWRYENREKKKLGGILRMR